MFSSKILVITSHSWFCCLSGLDTYSALSPSNCKQIPKVCSWHFRWTLPTVTGCRPRGLSGVPLFVSVPWPLFLPTDYNGSCGPLFLPTDYSRSLGPLFLPVDYSRSLRPLFLPIDYSRSLGPLFLPTDYSRSLGPLCVTPRCASDYPQHGCGNTGGETGPQHTLVFSSKGSMWLHND